MSIGSSPFSPLACLLSVAVLAGPAAARSVPDFLQLDPDQRAAYVLWGDIDDPNVPALLGEPMPELEGVLGEAHLGFDKETGLDLDHPGFSRASAEPGWRDPDKAPPTMDSIHFGPGRIMDTPRGLAADLAGQLSAGRAADEYLAVQFAYPVDLDLKTRLEARGVVFGDPLDPLSFYARIPPGALDALTAALDAGSIHHVGRIPAEWRLSVALAEQVEARLADDARVEVTVQLFEALTAARLDELGGFMDIERASSAAVALVEGSLPASRVALLAEHPAVQAIHERVVNESGAQWPMQGRIGVRPIRTNLEGNLAGGGDIAKNNGLTGAGVNVMVMDSGIAHQGSTYHPDLPLSRITDQYGYYPTVGNLATAIDSHGTHVAGSIGGSGLGAPGQSWQGIAPAVNFLIYRLCCNVPNGFGYFDADFQASLQRGASNQGDVSNNSWGGGNNTYAVSSQLADRAARGEYSGRSMNMVIITHNDNALSRSPGTAKNAISVGAVKDGNWPAGNFINCPGGGMDSNWPPGERVCFSNFGPIDVNGNGHSRIKPDLMAPGVRTRSAVAWYQFADNRYYDNFNGTSMAAPQVTGTVAQFLQGYPFYRNWPEVVKATLIASATDVGGSDTARYGRGMVNAYHAIYNQSGISTTRRWTASLAATGQNNDHTFTVPAGFSEVRVALAWSDPVAAGAGNDGVVNDLDLRVYDANNVLRASSLKVDDTVEYVKITTGAPGTWRIQARASSTSSAQPYGLAAVVIQRPAALTMTSFLEPRMGLLTGGNFFLYQTIQNSGFAAGGSYIRMQLPSTTLFTVEGARIYTRDGRSHYYSASELHNDLGGLFWRVAVGESIANHPRLVRWFISYNGPLECQPQSMVGNAYSRLAGALSTGGSTQSNFWPVVCDPLFEDRFRLTL